MGRKPARGAGQKLIGTTIAGRYALVRMLGDGGMGAVYKAEDNVLRRFVAIKLLHPAAAANPAAVERFLREAQAAASIGHPNIIDILDFGDAGDKPYLVMEYLRGRSLADAIHTDGPLPIRHACSIAGHALAGLQAAHDRGILHRDLKPANLMLVVRFGDRAFVKLLDFGFAALLGPAVGASKSLTPARTLVGTPAYAAPERLRGDDRRDPRTDLYSLGVVVFEMLAGVRPFDAPTFAELARKVQNERPPKLSLYRPDVPIALEKVIERALAKSPEERFANSEEFAAALVPFGARMVEPEGGDPSDSLTMDLIKIRARERATKPGGTGEHRPLTEAEAEATVLGKRTRGTDSSDLRLTVDPGREPLATERPPPPRSAPRRPSGLPAPNPSARQFGDSLRPPAPTATHRPAPPPAVPNVPRPPAPDSAVPQPAPGPRTYEGSVAVAILRFVSRRYGERALKQVLQSLPATAAAVFDEGVSPDSWLGADCITQLVEGIDAHLGRDDLHLVADCGRAVAEACFDRWRRLGPPAPPPELLLAEMPGVVAELMGGVTVNVRSVGRGYGRLELEEFDHPPSLTACVMLLGFLDRTLSRFGAREVEVNLLNCRYLGDDENLFDISWLVT